MKFPAQFQLDFLYLAIMCKMQMEANDMFAIFFFLIVGEPACMYVNHTLSKEARKECQVF